MRRGPKTGGSVRVSIERDHFRYTLRARTILRFYQGPENHNTNAMAHLNAAACSYINEGHARPNILMDMYDASLSR